LAHGAENPPREVVMQEEPVAYNSTYKSGRQARWMLPRGMAALREI